MEFFDMTILNILEDTVVKWLFNTMPTVGACGIAMWFTWWFRGVFIDSRNRFTAVEADSRQLGERIDKVEVKLTNRIDNVEMTLNNKIDNVEVKLNNKIDSVELKLNDKIDSVEANLNSKIDSVEVKLNDKIDNVEAKLTSHINAVETKLTSHINAVETKLTTHINAVEVKLTKLIVGVNTRLTNLMVELVDQKAIPAKSLVSFSPLALGEGGFKLLVESGGKKYIDDNLDTLIDEIKARNFKSSFDLQGYCRALVSFYHAADEGLLPIKEFVFNTSKYNLTKTRRIRLEWEDAVAVMCIYLRDKYFEIYPELWEKSRLWREANQGNTTELKNP